MKIKKSLKTILSLCLVIGVIASLCPVCVSATETTEDKYVTIYEQDFTAADATTDGWTTVDMAITDAGFGNYDGDYDGAPDATGYVIFNQNLGDNYKVSGSINYDGNIGQFYMNSDAAVQSGAAVINNGYNVIQNKVNLSLQKIVGGDDMGDFGHYAFLTDDANEIDLRATDGLQDPNNINFEISYNNGVLSYIVTCADGTINSFEHTISAPEFKSGLFAIAESSYNFWIKSIKIEKVMPEYVTVYEQDFTAAGATADGWTTENMSVTSNGLGNQYIAGDSAFGTVNEYGDVDGYAIYNEDLGTNYKVSGTINYSGNFGSFCFNTDGNARIITDAQGYKFVKVNDGYKINQGKQHVSAGIVIDENWGYDLVQNQFADVWEKENTTKNIDGVDVDFEITYNNGKITYLCECADGIINSFVYDLADFTSETKYESGKFILAESSYSYWIKNIRIEKAASEYVTLYEQDFTQNGATADGWTTENMSVTGKGLGNEYIEGNSAFGTSGSMYGSEDGYAIFNQNLGKNYKVSGTINYSGNFGSFYINSDGNVNFEKGDTQYIKAQNGYGINQNKAMLSAGLVIDGNWGYNQYQFTGLWEKANTTEGVDSVDVDFEITYNNGRITYLCKCDSGIINGFDFNLADFAGDTTRFESGKFMLVESSYSYWIKKIKIETVADYAISEVKASNDNGVVSYSALVYNWDGSLNDPALIAAVFDANGVMIDAQLIDYDGTAGINSVSGSITVDGGKVPDNVTIYFWKNLYKAAPLCEHRACEL